MDTKKKEQLKKKVNRTIDAYDEKITMLDERSKELSEEMKAGLYGAIADVKKKQEALKERSKEIADSSGDALKKLKTGIKTAAKDLKGSVKKASNELKKSGKS